MTVTTSQSPATTQILTSLHGRELGLDNTRGLIIHHEPFGIAFSAAPSTTNICLVTMQLIDNEGAAYAAAAEFEWWLSDAATGLGITAATASGAIAASTAGTDLAALVAKKLFRSQFDVTGKYIASITDSAKTGFFLAARLGRHSIARVSAALVAGNFG